MLKRGFLVSSLTITILALLASPFPLAAQSYATSASAGLRQIQFSGVLRSAAGEALPGTQGVIFALYADQQGGAALWIETQNVSTDASGGYAVLLGSATPGGLPQTAFSSNAARWLEVSTDGVPQPRVLLVSVPYALKAGDAETLGGLPASAFVLNSSAITARVGDAGGLPGATVNDVLPSAAVTAGRIAKFIDGAGATDDSIMTELTGKIGVNNAAPAETMDVDGSLRLTNHGQLKFHATGDPAVRYQMGVSGAGGMQFQSLDAGTPRRFFLVSSTGIALFQEELENGNITSFGKIGAGTAPLNTMDAAGNMAIGTYAGLNAAPAAGLIVSGNVGIGTPAPTQKLHVVGNILTSGTETSSAVVTSGFTLTGNGAGLNKVLTSDATGNASWATPASGNGNLSGTGTTGQFPKFTGPTTLGDSQLSEFASNVGVGTVPTTKLDVAGVVRARGGVQLDPGAPFSCTNCINSVQLDDATDLSDGGSVSGDITVTGSVTINESDGPSRPLREADAGDEPSSAQANGTLFTVNGTNGAFRFDSNGNVIFGNQTNAVTSGVTGAAISGGGQGNANRVTDSFGSVAGGSGNQAGDANANIGDRQFATVAGGLSNSAVGEKSSVGGGQQNTADGSASTIAGGYLNVVYDNYGAIGGGSGNVAGSLDGNVLNGQYATVPGGDLNHAKGTSSFAAGHRAKANHDGSFVWADLVGADFPSTGDNQFMIRATGGVGIMPFGVTPFSPSARLEVSGDIKVRDGGKFVGDGSGLTNLQTPGGVSGTGTANKLAKFSAATALANSQITDDGTNVTIDVSGGGVRVLSATNPNIISGHSGNWVSVGVKGAVIAGGGGPQ